VRALRWAGSFLLGCAVGVVLHYGGGRPGGAGRRGGLIQAPSLRPSSLP
jgi:hypothetical protein